MLSEDRGEIVSVVFGVALHNDHPFESVSLPLLQFEIFAQLKRNDQILIQIWVADAKFDCGSGVVVELVAGFSYVALALIIKRMMIFLGARAAFFL